MRFWNHQVLTEAVVQGVADGIDAASAGEHVLEGPNGQAEDLDVEVLILDLPPEKSVTHRTADDERASARGADLLQQASEARGQDEGDGHRG